MNSVLANISVDYVIHGKSECKQCLPLIKPMFLADGNNKEIYGHTFSGYSVRTTQGLEDASRNVNKRVIGFNNVNIEQTCSFGGPKKLMSGANDRLWLESTNAKSGSGTISTVYPTLVNREQINRKS